MQRRNLFFIGLISAILTVVSLNFAFGRSWNYHDRYFYREGYHHCYNYRDYDREHLQQNRLQPDSSTRNY